MDAGAELGPFKNDGGLEFQDTSDESDDSALDNVL